MVIHLRLFTVFLKMTWSLQAKVSEFSQSDRIFKNLAPIVGICRFGIEFSQSKANFEFWTDRYTDAGPPITVSVL